MAPKTLCLLGGGHVNASLLKAFRGDPGVRVVCVSNTDAPYYSGTLVVLFCFVFHVCVCMYLYRLRMHSPIPRPAHAACFWCSNVVCCDTC
jgi:NADH dehydrogenase FAD-containing subunit